MENEFTRLNENNASEIDKKNRTDLFGFTREYQIYLWRHKTDGSYVYRGRLYYLCIKVIWWEAC